MNHKRVFRGYREAGSAVRPRKRARRLVQGGFAAVPTLTAANQEWAVDWQHRCAGQRASDPRAERWKMNKHAGMRWRCPWTQVSASQRVTRGTGAVSWRNAGEATGDSLRHNGPEFTSAAFSGVVHRETDRAGAHSAGEAAAERATWKVSTRKLRGRAFDRELV